jgi:hypothetical protein
MGQDEISASSGRVPARSIGTRSRLDQRVRAHGDSSSRVRSVPSSLDRADVIERRMRETILLTVIASIACGSPPMRPLSDDQVQPIVSLPLGHASGQFHTLPVRVNDDVVTVAILDTGIGIALISQALCERVRCVVDGEFTGRRMSGQEVRVPLTRLDRLSIGGVDERDVVAGVIDIEGFFPEPEIEAFVGLPFFRERPFTIDGPQRILTIESERSLAAREELGTSVPIRLQAHGPALDTFVQMSLGDGRATAEVLMDTGSRVVILHPRYAQVLGVDLSGPGVRRREGTDETGRAYERLYVTLDGPIAFAGAPRLSRSGVEAMFQEIIYDGLIGTDLLESFVVTWDLARERIIVAANPRELSPR